MYIVDRQKNRIKKINEVMFGDFGIKEREHLQEWIANEPDCLGEDLLIIQKEFDGFDDTRERLDLLALDKDGNLVIIENKLDDSGKDVVWQALKYTSYCSTLTTDQILKIFQDYLVSEGRNDNAEDLIMEFLGINDREDLYLINRNDQRIIFVANNYRKEVTSTVTWLLKHDLQIQCFRISPSKMDEDLFLNIEQIIPQPDTEELMIRIKEKEKEGQRNRNTTEAQRRNVNFWTHFKKQFEDTGHNHLSKVSIPNRQYMSFGKGPAQFVFVFGTNPGFYRVEMYFPDDADKKHFDSLFKHKDEIERSLSQSVIWERLDSKENYKKASRIKIEHSAEDWDDLESGNWSKQFNWYIETFDNFYETIFPIWEKARLNY